MPLSCLDLRLVGGSGPHEGYLEVFHNGEWNRVLAEYTDLEKFSETEATVACRQLGYSDP